VILENPGPDHHQKLITSGESTLAHAYHVWSSSEKVTHSASAMALVFRRRKTILFSCITDKSINRLKWKLQTIGLTN